MQITVKKICILLASCMLIVAACNAPISYDAQKEARGGLDTAVRQIPSTSDFTVIKIVYREFYNNEDPSGKVAYFAKAFFVIVSSISPATLARDTYAKKIQDLGVG